MSEISKRQHKMPLAVFSPAYGVTSETFIRRHIEDVAPGRTVVVAYDDLSDSVSPVQGNIPRLLLNNLCLSELGCSLWDRLAFRLGVKPLAAVQMEATRRFFIKHGCEVFMGEYLDGSLPFLPVVKSLGMRFCVHAHGYDISQKLRDPFFRKEYKKYRAADVVITVNQIQKQRLIELGLMPEKIHVVPCGVDIPDDSCDRIPGKIVRCLSVGRMVGKKAPLLLLDAFRHAVSKIPNLHLDYIGDGPLMGKVKAYVHEHDLHDCVTLHGAQPVSTVHSFMRKSEIFIQHSVIDETGDEEGLPVAILEAMVHALPVVATRHAGIPEAVIEGETGLLVDEHDTLTMSKALAAIASDSARCIAMGLAGRERVVNMFSSQGEISSLRQLLFG